MLQVASSQLVPIMDSGQHIHQFDRPRVLSVNSLQSTTSLCSGVSSMIFGSL
jgi:hypothetical protein